MKDPIDMTYERFQQHADEKYRKAMTGKLPIMDEETLKHICTENDGYETPYLNDNLYAHFKGFQKIQGLETYTNLKALWLESNGLTKIENLSNLSQLRCLYLNKNLIESMENLQV